MYFVSFQCDEAMLEAGLQSLSCSDLPSGVFSLEGGMGSGKTTLTRHLGKVLGVAEVTLCRRDYRAECCITWMPTA
jgi:tRNA A37 threonylcarbamoyladenosine biosynthesis protein TsaE